MITKRLEQKQCIKLNMVKKLQHNAKKQSLSYNLRVKHQNTYNAHRIVFLDKHIIILLATSSLCKENLSLAMYI